MVGEAIFAHELKVGDSYEPLEFTISNDVNHQFLYAIAEFDPVYVGAAGRPGQLHPMILLHMSARTRSRSFRLAPNMGSVYARERVRFLRPAHVDEPLTTTWTIRDVYEKKGRLYQAMQIAVLAQGEPIIDREMHSVFFTLDQAGSGQRGTA